LQYYEKEVRADGALTKSGKPWEAVISLLRFFLCKSLFRRPDPLCNLSAHLEKILKFILSVEAVVCQMVKFSMDFIVFGKSRRKAANTKDNRRILKMPRHGDNIRKRTDGRWEGRYYVKDPKTGKSVLRSVYARTYSELKEKLSKMPGKKTFADSAEEGERPDAILLFGEVAEEWLTIVESTQKHATYMKYRTVYEKHLREKLGNCSFRELDSETLADVFRCEGKEALSGSLERSISCVLKQIFSHASVYYHISPPQYACEGKKAAAKPVETLNQTEQAKLLQCLYDEMDIYKLGIVVCLSTGLRLGEICSLKWEDIDFEGKLLHVNTTVQRIAVDGKNTRTTLLEGKPKSIFSKREIPLSDELIKLLCPYSGGAGEYVINKGKPMEPRTYQNKFHKYLQDAGVKKRNFHALRHTFATNCISSGADIKSVSEILGHSDVKITMNRYVHPTTETKRQHLNSLSAIYGQIAGQQ